MPEAVYTLTPSDFVTRDAFDVHVGSMRDRAKFEEKLNDARFDRIEALMAQNLAEQKAIVGGIEGNIAALNTHVNNRFTALDDWVDRLDQRMEKVEENIAEIKGDVKTLASRIDGQQIRIGWYLAALGLLIAGVQLWR